MIGTAVTVLKIQPLVPASHMKPSPATGGMKYRAATVAHLLSYHLLSSNCQLWGCQRVVPCFPQLYEQMILAELREYTEGVSNLVFIKNYQTLYIVLFSFFLREFKKELLPEGLLPKNAGKAQACRFNKHSRGFCVGGLQTPEVLSLKSSS